MSSINITINQLNEAAPVVILFLSIINFVPGAIGLILNILIFTRSTLRREPCAVYFFWTTCFSLFVIFIILPERTLAVSFSIDMSAYSVVICKIEYFAFYAVRSISSWSIVLACIDRYFNSSSIARIRRLSSLKIARMSIAFISVTIGILYIHVLVYFEISYTTDQFGNIAPTCNGQRGIYRTFLGFWHMILYSLCPSFLMLLFGFLTLNNLRLHRQIVSRAIVTNQIVRRTDIQLLRMLFAQVFVIIISTLPFSVNQIYGSFTAGLSKSTLRIAQETLASRIVATITHFTHSSCFYLYTLTGTIFRKELYKIIRRCWCANRNNLRTVPVEMQQIRTLPHN